MEKIFGEIFTVLADKVVAIFLFAGLFLIVLGLAGGFWSLPIVDPIKQWASVLIGFGFIAIGIYLHLNAPSTLPNAKKLNVKISSPRQNDRVDIVDVQYTMTGTIPRDYDLRVLRIYPKSRDAIYPLKVAVSQQPDGTWIAKDCDIGGSPGESRRLGIYLIGPAGKALLAYLERVEDTRDSLKKDLKPGAEFKVPLIRMRTPDMIKCDEVHLYRKVT